MKAAELIARLFAARTAAHMAHLQTTSYAQHVALDGFYSGIVDKTDAFAEAYQGIYGVIETYPPSPLPTGNAATWLATLRTWVRANREAAADGNTELANMIDDILALFDSTIYKLKTLK